MALALVSFEPGKPGLIAVGGDAVGLVAVGVSATGVIAIGVQARGLVAISCGTSVGAVALSFGASVGLLATSVGFAGGIWGGAYGIELPIWPGSLPRKLRSTGEGSLEGQVPGESRWLRATVERAGSSWKVSHGGAALDAELTPAARHAATRGPARALVGMEKDKTRHVLRLEPLTSLAWARLAWGANLLVRFAALAAIAWFLSR